MKIYLCCALSTASAEFKQKVEALKAYIKTHYPSWQILEFFGLGPAANDGEIFRYDVDRVSEADLIVVLCDEPTWGGGIEIGMALEWGKDLLFVAPRGWKKTRMITGLCETHPNQTMFVPCLSPDGFSEIISAISMAETRFELHLPASTRSARKIWSVAGNQGKGHN